MKPPISDPFEAPDSNLPSEETKFFRYRFWPYFLSTLSAILSLSLPTICLISIGGEPWIRATMLLGSTTACALYTLLVTWAVSIFQPVKLNCWAIHAPSIWGNRREIEWAQIQEVRYFWLFYPFALISTPQKRNFIWLPLILRDMKGFARAVEEWAPADNPLRLFLQKRGF
ncbi:MAG: hypothetical protein KY445_16615 [Armatimonadetes bacterium]|nr:hypothetical protein [Armatimonadota bacterium]